VDHFKRVNDRLGHAAGDSVLVQFGQRLRGELRESDDLVRWGGEEFLAVAHDTEHGRAAELAERLRSAIADRPFVLDHGRTLAVSCSIGWACLPFVAAHPQGTPWPEVVQFADLALRGAKRLGRNTWLGIAAGPTARPEGLLPRTLNAPAALLAAGELQLTGQRPAAELQRALAPDAPDAPA
jgi:diguanylate cyclase (GGDEF)-like protein